MNSQPPTNSTGPITKPAVTQSSNVSSEQGVYKLFELFKWIKLMLMFKTENTHIDDQVMIVFTDKIIFKEVLIL